MAPLFAFRFNYHLGQAYQGLSRQILPTKRDYELKESDHVLHSTGDQVTLRGLGVFQRSTEVVPTSWSSMVDDCANILQGHYTSHEVHDRRGVGLEVSSISMSA